MNQVFAKFMHITSFTMPHLTACKSLIQESCNIMVLSYSSLIAFYCVRLENFKLITLTYIIHAYVKFFFTRSQHKSALRQWFNIVLHHCSFRFKPQQHFYHIRLENARKRDFTLHHLCNLIYCSRNHLPHLHQKVILVDCNMSILLDLSFSWFLLHWQLNCVQKNHYCLHQESASFWIETSFIYIT